jgi:malate dehydrogenase (oxaloacetate-decarboxylating)
MDYNEKALEMHEKWRGKIRIETPCPLESRDDLSVAYTPGVAAPCLEIQRDPEKSFTYTRRGNLVAVVTDGTAVLGLGDIGPEAGMPVMEGKCALFKAFADVDAFPLCVRSKDVDEIVHAVELIAGSFGGINLEDIAAPRCFEVERKLKERLDIPVFHDDQHGTAVVTVAAMINALKVVHKEIGEVSAVVNGAGAAGTACTRLLMALGLKNVVVCDKQGALCPGEEWMTPAQAELAEITNPERKRGTLADVIKGADVFMLLGAGVRHKGDGGVYGGGRYSLCLRQPHAGDIPRRGESGGGQSGGLRAVGLREPDKQCTVLSGDIPRSFGRAGQGDKRGDEAGGGKGAGGDNPGGGTFGGEYYPQRL